MTESYDFAKQCKRLADEAIPRVADVQRRIAEGPQPFIQVGGRKYDDDDPKRGGQSPLGGKVW